MTKNMRSCLVGLIAGWTIIFVPDPGTFAVAQQAPPSPRGPAKEAAPFDDIARSVTDWLDRASREYQDSVVQPLSVPTGKGLPLAETPPGAKPTAGPVAASAREPSVSDQVRKLLGLDPLADPPPPATVSPTPDPVAEAKARERKAEADAALQRQAEAREIERRRVAEEQRLAEDARRAREAVDQATQQRQKTAEAARSAEEQRRKGTPAAPQTAEAEERKKVAQQAQLDQQKADQLKADRLKAEDAARRDTERKEAERKEAERKEAERKDNERKQRELAEAARRKALDEQKLAERAAADRAAADRERQAKAEAEEKAKAQAAPQVQAQAQPKPQPGGLQVPPQPPSTGVTREASGDKKPASTKPAADGSARTAAPRSGETAATPDPRAAATGADRTAGKSAVSAQQAQASSGGRRHIAASGGSLLGAEIAAYASRPHAGSKRCAKAGRDSELPGSYVVKKGDTLWAIAKRHYAKGLRYDRIVRANQASISDPDLIFPCQKLFLPRRHAFLWVPLSAYGIDVL